jgi:MtN3 and saliva related transmembrane protein
MIEAIGWASSLALLGTIIAQVKRQWEAESNEGVSKWLFVGQMTASAGFTVYSTLTGNTVFIVTNAALFVSSVAGLAIHAHNARKK